MKALFELMVVVLFFITYFLTKNIIYATAVALVFGIIQAAWTWLKFKKLETMQWISLILIIAFGGATILFRDERFIMWKPSVLFWVMAIGLGGSHFFGKNILKTTLGREIKLPEIIWFRLTIAWVIFFAVMGVINLWVAFHFTRDQWVSYKLFGSFGLMIAFTIAQTVFLARYLKHKE